MGCNHNSNGYGLYFRSYTTYESLRISNTSNLEKMKLKRWKNSGNFNSIIWSDTNNKNTCEQECTYDKSHVTTS